MNDRDYINCLIDAKNDKIKELEEEKELLEQAINELMVQCDIKYFRFRDKEFYKQEYGLDLSSDKN